MTLSLPLAVLDAMVDAGCTAAQIVAALRAAEHARLERRAELAARRAARLAASGHVASGASQPGPVLAPVAPAAVAPVLGSGGITRARGRQGLGLARGLSGTARQVGAALLEYCNAGLGVAWPSVGTLAEKLGISTRSVKRATAALDDAGLIRRNVHPGRVTTYQPIWAALGEVAGDWDIAKLLPSAPASRATAAAKWGQNRPPTGAKTGPVNQYRKPALQAEPVARRRKPPDPRQPPLLLPIPGGRTKSDPAYGEAGARLWGQLRSHSELFDLVISDAQLLDAATLAELRQPNEGGLALIRGRLGNSRSPPPSTATG